MESESPDPGRVKQSAKKFAHKLAANLPAQCAGEHSDVPPPDNSASPAPELLEAEPSPGEKFPESIPANLLENCCRRFDGYAEYIGQKPWELMSVLKVKLQKKTKLSADHIDRASRHWMKWTANFRFKKHRFNRSTCIVITRVNRPLILTRAGVRRRLVGAIENYVEKAGVAYVNRKFLENFHHRYGLPPEAIFYAWAKLYRIEGCLCHWQGAGNGKTFVVMTPETAARKTARRQKTARVSHRHFTSGISPLRGIDRKTTAPPVRSQTESSSSAASPAWPGDARRDFPEESTANRSPPTPGEDDQSTAATAAPGPDPPKPLGNDHACDHWPAVWKPLHVCGRWIGPTRLDRKTRFLVFGVLEPMHERFQLVEWRPGYAWRFVAEAIAMGFLDSEIVAAYRTGLEESNRAAVKDGPPRLTAREDGAQVWQRDRRVPSQAIAIAWRILREDTRSDEERWAAIFRGEVAPAGEKLKTARSTTAPKTARKRAPAPAPAPPPPEKPAADPKAEEIAAIFDSTTTPAMQRQLLRLDAKLNPTFEAHMKARGLDTAALLRLSRGEQQKFVREAFQKQRPASQKG